MSFPFSSIFLLLSLLCTSALSKYTHRLFVNSKAVRFADPTRHGFRLVLLDEFVASQLAAELLPTVFLSVIPLDKNERQSVQVVYPDVRLYQDKQLNVIGLMTNAWYYVCIEWENFRRHNETTGTDCRLFRTLDRFGKAASSTITSVKLDSITASSLDFHLNCTASFPVQVTAFLAGGPAISSVVTFSVRASVRLDVHFDHLRPATDYGRLCITETPLVVVRSALGRLVGPDISMERCHLAKLTTDEYQWMNSRQESFDGTVGKRAHRHFFASPIVITVILALALR